jgi:large subunit ribosomal protein L14
MVQPGTQLYVQDNSGGRLVKCIKILKKNRGVGLVGDFIIVSIKKLRKKGRIQVKKKELCIALIVKVCQTFHRHSGISIRSARNSCTLFNMQYKAHGTRVLGTLDKKIRNLHKFKLLAMASRFV